MDTKEFTKEFLEELEDFFERCGFRNWEFKTSYDNTLTAQISGVSISWEIGQTKETITYDDVKLDFKEYGERNHKLLELYNKYKYFYHCYFKGVKRSQPQYSDLKFEVIFDDREVGQDFLYAILGNLNWDLKDENAEKDNFEVLKKLFAEFEISPQVVLKYKDNKEETYYECPDYISVSRFE